MAIKSRKRPKLFDYALSREERMNLKAIESGAEVFERLFVKHGGRGEWYGQEITDLLTGVHEDYLHFVEQRYNPQIILYYRDLLSYLVKTYGH